MTDSRKVQLSAEMDASGVRSGTEDVKDAVRDMTRTVAQEGGKAAQSIAAVGDGGQQAADKVTRADGRIIASLQRKTAMLEAAGKGERAYQEALIRNRGGDVSLYKVYLDQIDAAERAQKAASGSLDKIGTSARQTAAALRGVPAQFTDIVTSLQGGQAPLTVLLQQGGQLRDMFGGVGAAAKALGGFVLGLVNPYTLAAAAVGGLAYAFNAGASEAQAFAKATIVSGQAAGVTVGRLGDMAAAVQQLGAGTQGAAAEVLAQLAQSGGVGAQNMERFTAAALQFERVGGPAASETAKAFADLAKSPLEGALKLNEATNFLTRSTYEQIKALQEQGRTIDAARVAQEAYAAAIEERAPQLLNNLGYIERAWLAVKDATKAAADSVLSIGRTLGPEQAAAALRNRIASVQAGNEGREGKSRLPELQAQLQALEQGAKYEALNAFYASERAAAVKAGAEWDKETDKYLSKRAQQEREIAQAEALGIAAGRSRAEIERQIAAIREKFAEKSPQRTGAAGDAFAADRAAAKDWATAFERFSAAVTEADGKTAGLTRSQIALIDYLKSPGYQQMGEPARQLALQQAYAAVSAEQLAAVMKDYTQVAAEAARSYAKWVDEINQGALGAEQQIEKLQLEAEAADLAATSYVSLAQAVELVQIARLKERQDALTGDNVATDALQREIDARRKLVELIGSRDARAASQKAAEDTAADWKKASESINQSITDALMRGFESGKDFARNFRDTLVNMFNTLVLRPIVQWAVQPVQDLVTGFLGGGPAGAKPGGTSMISSASNYYGIARNLSAGFSGLSLGVANAAGAASANIAGTGLDGLLASNGAYGTAGTGAGWAGTLGTAAGIGAGVLGGVYGGRAISSGYSAFGGSSGNSAVNTGTAIGAAVGSIVPVLGTALGALIGGLAGGTVNRLFGRKAPEVTDQGISGSIGGGDFSGTAYRDVLEKGGTFRKDKRYTQTTALPDELSRYLDTASRSLFNEVSALGKTLQLPVDQLAGISTKIRATLGADAKKNEEAIAAALTTYTDDLVMTFKGQLEPMRQYGESLRDTLSRLSVLQTFSDGLKQLGGVFSKVANLSVDVRQSFIEMAGGMAELNQKALKFAQDYYNREEVAGLKAAELQTVLSNAGIKAGEIGSRDDFRRLVDATDVSTAAGREQLAVLLNVADSFTQVADYIAETGSTLARVAAQAPTGGPVASLIAPTARVDSAEQVVAINGVESAVGRVAGLISQLLDVVKANKTTGFSLEVVRP